MAKNIEVKILGDNKDFRKALDDSEGRASKFSSSIGKVGLAVGAAFAGAAVGAAVLGKGAFDAAIESQKIGAQTEAVVKSMGLQSTVTADQIGEMAAALSVKNAVDDEAIQTGQNLLLTFGNLAETAGTAGGAFERASQVMVDMGAAMGTDAKSSAVQLGKALNDPVKGITALTKSGVSFTEQQREQIKAMTEAGDIAGAQEIILGALEQQFGGSAAAQATATDRMGIAFGNLQEQIGGYLIPIIERLATWIVDTLVPALERYMPKAIAAVRSAIGSVVEAFRTFFTAAAQSVYNFFDENRAVLAGVATLIGGGLVAAFVAWTVATYAQVTAQIALAATWVAAHAPIIAIIAALALLVAGVVYAYQNFETFRTLVDTVRAWMVDTLWPAIQQVAAGIVAAITTMINAVKAVITTVTAAITVIWETWGDEILAYITNAFETIRAVVEAVIGVIRGIMKTVTALIKGDWQGVWDGIKQILSSTWDGIKGIVSGALGAVKILINGAVSGIKAALTKPYTEAKDLIVDTVNTVVTFVGGMPARLTDMVGDFLSAGLSLGRAVLDGIIDGIAGAVQVVGNIASAVADAVRSAVKSAANAVIGQVNSALEFRINGPGFLPDINLNPPDIPRFHSGGVIPGRPGREVPIMALAGETVFTRDQMTALGDGRGSRNRFPTPSPRTASAVLMVDGDRLAATVTRSLQRELTGAR